MKDFLTRIGVLLSLAGGVLMAPNAFSEKRIERARKRVHKVSKKAHAMLGLVGDVLGELVVCLIVGCVIFVALAAFNWVAKWFDGLWWAKGPSAVLLLIPVLVSLALAAVALVLIGVAVVLGVASLFLWATARLLSTATSKPSALLRAGGTLFLIGGVLALGATFVR